MKKRSLLLIVFVMLYITPVIFSTSSMSTGIVAEPFTLSDYGDISNQSVLSLDRTLPDEVLFYPDVSTSDIYFGTSGDSDYEETFVKDGVYFTVLTGNKDIHIAFNETTTQIEGFDYAIFGYEAIDDGYCKYYQYPGWTSLIAFTVTPSWYNGSVVFTGGLLHGESNNYTVTLKFDASVSANLYIDYAQIQFKYLTLQDSEHYVESFTDVSDWNYPTGAGEDISTDGDLGKVSSSAGLVWDRYDCNVPDGDNWFNYYVEIRWKANDTGGRLYIYTMQADDYSGGVSHTEVIVNPTVDTDWHTTKYLHSENEGTTVECVTILVKANLVNVAFEIDYFRISRANETGFRNDGSNALNVNSSTGDTISSDGEQLHLESGVGDDNSFEIEVDTTTTQSAIDCSYYPFLEIKTTGISEGDGWKLELFDGSDWIEITDGPYFGWMAYEYGIGIFRYNIETLADEVYTFRINTTATADIYIDYIWMNSIANFTLSSGSSNTVDDVLYCEDGTLYSLTTEGSNRHWILDYDIALSIPFLFNNYSLAVSANTQWFAEYIGGWEDWKVDEPSGILTKGTVTDFKILIDGTLALSSILFIETLSWQSLDGVTFYFVIGSIYGSWTIQSLLVFLGLGLIPVSTIFLVYGGRENLSMDKVFYFFIMFIIGWALVIGGIMS